MLEFLKFLIRLIISPFLLVALLIIFALTSVGLIGRYLFWPGTIVEIKKHF